MIHPWNLALTVIFLAACGAAEGPSEPAADLSPVSLPQTDGRAEDGPTDLGTAVEPEDAEPHSVHHRLRLFAGDYIGASVEVRVDEVPKHGLRFFALQVNFSDVAWAHGGLQGGPGDGKANWGGLVSGIDYAFEGAEQQVLAAVQNLPGRTAEVSWQQKKWYRYEVMRGELEQLAPGEYSVLDEEPVTVTEAREMWRWTFRIVEVDGGEVVWEHDVLVAHPWITSGTYWTETGYGIECTDVLTVQWRSPQFQREDGTSLLPASMEKSMAQSDCPSDRTTEMASVDNGGQWGTTQWYGVERAATSNDGDLLYYRRPNR